MNFRSRHGLALAFAAALISLVALAANAADPFTHITADEAAIMGGIDPHGDSWLSIQHSIGQLEQPFFILRLFLSLTLSVVTASIIAWHPRSSNREALAELEERKTLMILGMVGAAVAELSMINHSLALVIFGIGALLRFRTVLDNPEGDRQGDPCRSYRACLRCRGLGDGDPSDRVQLDTYLLAGLRASQCGCRSGWTRASIPNRCSAPSNLC